MDSYQEYVYHSGEIVFSSLAFKRGEGFIAFNFVQAKNIDDSVQTMKEDHPVREKIYEWHRREFS